MGYITEQAMLPVLVFLVLMKETDDRTVMSTNVLVDILLEFYEPEGKTRQAFVRRVQRCIEMMNFAFEEIDSRGDFDIPYRISNTKPTIPGEYGPHTKGYYMDGKPLSNMDIALLSDSVIYSRGIGKDNVTGMLDKLQMLATSNYRKCFSYIATSDVVPRTNNEMVFENICEFGEAIKERKSVSFIYDGTLYEDVCPYYLVKCKDNYYLICNRTEEEGLHHCRIDKIYNVNKNNRYIRAGIDSVYGKSFHLDTYLREHPRMYSDPVVNLTLTIREALYDSFKMEFNVIKEYRATNKETTSEGKWKKLMVRSTKRAVSNWIINVSNDVFIESNNYNGKETIEMVCNAAEAVLRRYNYQYQYSDN